MKTVRLCVLCHVSGNRGNPEYPWQPDDPWPQRPDSGSVLCCHCHSTGGDKWRRPSYCLHQTRWAEQWLCIPSSCLHHDNETRNPHLISNIINLWLLLVFKCFHVQSVGSFLSCDSEFLLCHLSYQHHWIFLNTEDSHRHKLLWILNSCEF